MERQGEYYYNPKDFEEPQIIVPQSNEGIRPNPGPNPNAAMNPYQNNPNIPNNYPQLPIPPIYVPMGNGGILPPQQYHPNPVYANNQNNPVPNGFNPPYPNNPGNMNNPNPYPQFNILPPPPLIPQNPYIQPPPPNAGLQPGPVGLQFGNTGYQFNDAEKKILKFARIVRYMAVLEVIDNLFYLMQTPYLIFMIAFCGLGYLGGRRFNKWMCSGYAAFLIFMVISRIVIMRYFPFIYVVIIYIALMAFEIAQIIILAIFIRLLHGLPDQGRKELASFINGMPPNLCNRCYV